MPACLSELEQLTGNTEGEDEEGECEGDFTAGEVVVVLESAARLHAVTRYVERVQAGAVPNVVLACDATQHFKVKQKNKPSQTWWVFFFKVKVKFKGRAYVYSRHAKF